MDFLPILATLKRHKTAAGLIVLQVALTCAIVCNALFLISQRVERINVASGMAESEMIVLRVSGLSRSLDPDSTSRADLQALRALPGVKSAALLNQIHFNNNNNDSGIRLKPEPPGPGESLINASNYMGSEGWLQTMGLKLVAGRDFTVDEYQDLTAFDKADAPALPAVIINVNLAERLFGSEPAVGKTVYLDGPQPVKVVGVLETLLAPLPGGNRDANRLSMVFPLRPNFRNGVFVLRVAQDQRDALLTAATAVIEKNDSQRVVRQKLIFTDMRDTYYRQDRNMVWLLGGVCVALLAVTAFGIVGLASFWVQQRTRMIGTRRAMGATRVQILRYFQTENFLLTCLGIVVGVCGAYGISLLLMRNYELPRLPLGYVVVGAAALWALGQIAVLAPARRAAALAPVAALRA